MIPAPPLSPYLRRALELAEEVQPDLRRRRGLRRRPDLHADVPRPPVPCDGDEDCDDELEPDLARPLELEEG